MKLRTYVTLLIAVAAGLLAAYATYDLTAQNYRTHQTDTGKDTAPGPLF
ncbi:MAG TPA: hypothetical protein VN154_05300 [Rhizomicrobium sp.]|nr:hypothetical protein [Rhizomicrobium sp.]